MYREQAQQYAKQGYFVLPDCFSSTELQLLQATAAGIVNDFDIERHRSVFKTTDRDAGRDEYFLRSAEAVHCFLEEGSLDADGELLVPRERAINKIGHALHDLVPAFTRFCRLPVFGRLLDALGCRDPLLWQSMYIFKQPRIGGEVRWHQDASYLHTPNGDVVGMWLALEDATLENGCLWVAPGAHHSPLREIYAVDWERRQGQLVVLDATPWPAADAAVPLEVAAGSLVVFHDHMPHYSAPNHSERSRAALTLHFASAASSWSATNWLQRPRLGAFRIAASGLDPAASAQPVQ